MEWARDRVRPCRQVIAHVSGPKHAVSNPIAANVNVRNLLVGKYGQNCD